MTGNRALDSTSEEDAVETESEELLVVSLLKAFIFACMLGEQGSLAIKLTRAITASQSSILRPALVKFLALNRKMVERMTSMLKMTVIIIRPTRSLTSAKPLFSTSIAATAAFSLWI